MSDYDDNDNYDPDDAAEVSDREKPESTRKNNWRRELEQQAEEGRKAAAEAAAAKKELAFLKAGIDLDTPQGKLFAKAYDGDATPDAVKAAAVEYGVIEAPQAQVPAEELAAHDRFTQAAGGAQQSDADQYAAAIEQAETPADVLAALRAANPELVDTGYGIRKWENGGGQNTPVTTPLS